MHILLLVSFSTMSLADEPRDVVFGLLLISDDSADNKLAAKDLYHLPPEDPKAFRPCCMGIDEPSIA